MRSRSAGAAMAAAALLLLPALAGAQNRALGRPTFSSGSTDPVIAAAANAVDGNTNGNYSAGSTFHSTAGPASWWYVALDGAYDVTQVDFWNRTDDSIGRIIGATIGLFGAAPYGPGGPAPLATATIGTDAAHSTFLFPSVSAQYVGVHLSNANGSYLQIAELEVFGQPTAISTAPEPGTWALLGSGLLALGGLARRRRTR